MLSCWNGLWHLDSIFGEQSIKNIVKIKVEELGTKLADVVKATYEEVKDLFDGITEKDIHDVIRGVYSEKKETKNEIAAAMRELKSEAELLSELERVSAGIPKT